MTSSQCIRFNWFNPSTHLPCGIYGGGGGSIIAESSLKAGPAGLYIFGEFWSVDMRKKRKTLTKTSCLDPDRHGSLPRYGIDFTRIEDVDPYPDLL